MIQFTSLRLSGFKSFVDATELLIEPGMTGIVGPNGCGKSNLVEALRWVMGETSAKQMRGGEMDDVIFGGTSNRPPRNVAEVVLHLDNARRSAPTQFNDHAELEITRRIARGDGSAYRVNGKEVRARDVMLLFADAATGARSTAMVSQGRIGSIINARPADRRSLLEEAAGISGLHSRRHEAELRMKAAEGNLARLEDVLTTLDAQLQNLKKQARQAARYRALSEQIRQVEARLLFRHWIGAIRAFDAARAALSQTEGKVAELTGKAASAAARQTEAAAGLPPLRQIEAEAAAKVQRLLVAAEQLDAEEGRLSEQRRDLDQRLAQTAADLDRESARAADAAGAAARLGEERAAIVAACAGETDEQAAAKSGMDEVAAAVTAREGDLTRLMEEVAAADAQRGAAIKRLAEAETRRERLAERAAQIEALRAAAAAEGVGEADLTSAEMEVEAAQEFLTASQDAAEAADRARTEAQAAREAARDALQTLAADRARLRAEADALKELLAEASGGEHKPVLDDMTAVDGYETALGAALGEDLSSPLDADAPLRWQTLPPLSPPPPLPEGAEPLSRFVTAPPALARRLGQIGVVSDAAIGHGLRHDLKPGQRLVTQGGDVWRWDGFTIAAGAPSAAAVRLRQRNRLRDLQTRIDDADLGVAKAEAAARQASEAMEAAAEAERQARDSVRKADAESAKARDALARLTQKAAAAESRVSALAEQAGRIAADLSEAEAEQAEARVALAAFADDGGDGRERVAALRADLAEQRGALVEARGTLDRLIREAGDRRRRIETIDADSASWAQRAASSEKHRQELDQRRAAVTDEIARLVDLPGRIALRRSALLDETQTADAERKATADALAAAESALAEADKAAKAAEHDLAAAREERVRAEAQLEAANEACRTVAGRIAERLDCTPEQLRELVEGGGDEAADELERRLDRLVREREGMGPVNLRAETEAEELEAQIAALQTERQDLVSAIAKLRQAIGELNREGRERLLTSFREVDEHFRTLFVRLFGGGRAHLALTESDDPLQAGLEIMASPPGKRLQILSLLSGGEQALTALALLFAVFMTNPAPICVLDEVDAPLDDANVDRFCSLVEEIARSAATRFLVITHHRMTMARMDRLFGVTMAERGISQLVSVDLRRAEELRDSA